MENCHHRSATHVSRRRVLQATGMLGAATALSATALAPTGLALTPG